MSHSEKLYFARIGTALLFIFVATLTLMYFEQVSDWILRECTERLSASLNRAGGSLANR